jgi:malate permease and related proteins
MREAAMGRSSAFRDKIPPVTLLLSIFANDVLPIFLVGGVGFLAARMLGAEVRTLSRISLNALSPCLVFHLLVTSKVGADDFLKMTALAAIAILGVGVIARGVAAVFRLDRAMTAAFLVVVMFSNSGNYGLPVVLFAFGRDALAHGTVYFAANAVAIYTLGVFLASAGHRSVPDALKGVLRVPAVWGVACAGLVMWLHLEVPQMLMRPVELLSGAALPMMILVLGMQFERSSWPERPGLVAAAVALSLMVTPALASGAAYLLGVTGVARQAAILQSGMPSAVLTTVLALEYNVAPSFVTACVLLSTIASPVTVTLLIAALQ